MSLLIFAAAWADLCCATACLFYAIERREQPTKRISQRDADRFDVRKAIPLFSPIRNGAVNSHSGPINR